MPETSKTIPGSEDAAGDGEPVEATDPRPDPDEAALVARAGSGDRDAFRELVERHQSFVLRLATRMLRYRRDLAEDVCQEVFLRAWRALERFDGRVRFAIWIHRITVNACISEVRKQRAGKRAAPTFSIDDPGPAGSADDRSDRGFDPAESRPGHDPVDRAHDREFGEAVRMALGQLPDEFRSAVLLRDLQGLSYEEISEILEVPPGTVRSRIHRGRVQLQEILEEFRP